MTDKEKIREEVVRMHNLLPIMDGDNISVNYADRICTTLEMYIDSLQEEPVSEDLEEAAVEAFKQIVDSDKNNFLEIFKAGAEWQKAQEYTCYEEAFEDGAKWKVENLWKPADGDDLPEIDREVIALLNSGKVVFAHRPYKEKYIGKNFTTGNIETFENKTYDEGGWNIPDVKFWLDVELPKEIEL